MTRLRSVSIAALSTVAFGLSLTAAMPAQAMPAYEGKSRAACLEPASAGAGARSASGGSRQADHREISLREQRAIERRTARILARRGVSTAESTQLAVSVPVYYHVMMDKAGNGNVTAKQLNDQTTVLNTTFGGGESTTAANTGFTFTKAGVDRYYNSTWHRDGASARYRSKTRLGGANALNIWLVDFEYLGIATFPWDYAARPPEGRWHRGQRQLAARRVDRQLQPR